MKFAVRRLGIFERNVTLLSEFLETNRTLSARNSQS